MPQLSPVAPMHGFRGCPVRLEKIWRIKGITPPPARPQDRQPPPRRPPTEPRIDPRTNLPPPPQTPHPFNQQKPRHYIPNPSSFPSLQPPIPKPLPTPPTPKVIPPTPQVVPPAFVPPTMPTPARVEAGTQTEEPTVEEMEIHTPAVAPILNKEMGTQTEDFPVKQDMKPRPAK
ncbi:uncharacterized protein LOC135217242 [Macrobrachium nipponense]|uniref:uncharacterized protein LOC135217242 n=1 Tax=Macrobrachium nipponense TaxID=159736 RepID=UPI0030C7ACE1